MQRVPLETLREYDPGELIADKTIRELYFRFLEAICGIHDEVQLKTLRLESRAFFRGKLLCRVVPYRKLFHVRVGDKNPWESRVRDGASCLETLDSVLARFLDVYACRDSATRAPRFSHRPRE